jgi:deoxyadenosine/deoxycytidine kinase
MAKYVEFLGVSGVGKTTTYKYLFKEHNSKHNWIPYEELCKDQYHHTHSFKDLLEYRLYKLFKPNHIPRIPHNREALNKFVNQNRDFLENFWKTMYDCKEDINLRFYKTNYIRDIIEKIQNVRDSASNKYCLIDEGLIHNLNYFINPKTPPSEIEVEKLLNQIELPDGIVYFKGALDTILDRTMNRGSLRAGEKNLSSEELVFKKNQSIKEKSLFVNCIKGFKIPILIVDAQDPITAKAEKIKGFLSTLHERNPSAEGIEKKTTPFLK